MEKEISKLDVLNFLRRNPIMNISICYEDRPIASVVLFYVDEEFNIYFVTKSNTYKTKALLSCNKLSYSVWAHKEMMVQADGIASVIYDSFLQDDILNKIVASTTNIEDFWPPALHTEEYPYMYFKVSPTWLRAMDISSVNISQKEPPFTTIINEYK